MPHQGLHTSSVSGPLSSPCPNVDWLDIIQCYADNIRAWVHGCSSSVVSWRWCFTQSSLVSFFGSISGLCSSKSPSLGGVCTCMRSGGERGAVFQYSYPLHFNQRWVSELATVYCPKHILWWRLRASLIYGSREENRKDSVMLYPLSRMILGDSSRLTPKASTCHFRFLFLSLVCVSVSKAKCLTTWKKHVSILFDF